MKTLASDYLWPAVGRRQRISVEDSVWELVQPVITRTTAILKLQNKVPLLEFPGEARGLGILRERVDSRLAALFVCISAGSAEELPGKISGLNSALDALEADLQKGLASAAAEVRPKIRKLII